MDLVFDIIWGTFLLGVELLLLIIFLAICVILLLHFYEWHKYARFKRSLLRADAKEARKLDEDGGVHARIRT